MKILRILTVVSAAAFALAGCEGEVGPAGPEGGIGGPGAIGPAGDACSVVDNMDGTYDVTCDGTTITVSDAAELAAIQARIDEASNVEPETCVICHADTPMDKHQSVYDDYVDMSNLELEILSVVSSNSPAPTCLGTKSCKVGTDCMDGTCDDTNGDGIKLCEGQVNDAWCADKSCDTGDVCAGEYSSTLTFMVKKNGVPLIDLNVDPQKDDLPSLLQKRFIAATFNSVTGEFEAGGKYFNKFKAVDAVNNPGVYEAYAAAPGGYGPLPWAPESTNGLVYGYVADELLGTESGGHVHMYDNVASDAFVVGTLVPGSATATANVSGCVNCHGTPYMKHGYRDPVIEGLDDFVSCKTCHYDARNGGHEDWQILVDDPERYVEIAGGADLTAAEEALYAYKATLMNDVHMSHAMEFPYPQSIANCATCHEEKTPAILVDANFTRATCRSCHALTGSAEYGTRENSIEGVWEAAGVAVSGTHDIAWFDADSTAAECNAACHTTGGFATTMMSDLHNGGYDAQIYTTDGALRYSDVFVTTIDAAALDAMTNTLTVEFSATEVGGSTAVAGLDADDIVPTLIIGLYGYDTKDFIVAAHGRDDDRNRLLEFPIDGSTTNPRFTTVTATGGAWEVDVDLSMWADMITDGTIRRAEIGVLPAQTVVVGDEDVDVGTCDPSCGRGTYCASTDTCEDDDDFMLALNAPSRTFDLGTNDFDDGFYSDIVDVEGGCNSCHDALATTFHSANRGGNIKVCRMCHVTLSGGSHLELQSRSIDSYVHAVHTFQAFDPDEVDFTDPVEALLYDHHLEHVFPNFTAKNCESCHNAGMYQVPDQSKSLPGRISGTFDVAGRDIMTIPDLVSGPGARACGGCHRAHAINEDDANRLAAFNQHTKSNGYLLEDADGVFDVVVDTIMSIFY